MKAWLLLLAALIACPLPTDLQAQKKRPIPYPVLLPPQFEQAVQKGTRTLTGMPGPNYWTNTADYTLRATLSPATRMLRGHATIQYQNNSPDELRQVMVHLRQNLHREGAVRNRPQQLTGGVRLSDVRFNGTPLVEQPATRKIGYAVNGSVMRITPPEPVPAGGSATIEISWSFEVPEAGAPRMGQDREVFFLGYWYPQVAVYDDVNGWKAEQYMGNGEFYMGYGSYDVAITMPEGWLVAATGVLQNPEEVLAPAVRQRLAQAGQSQEVVQVVGEAEREAGKSTATHPTGQLTWRYAASNVRDFAFGTSDRYVWDAATADVGDRDGDGQDDISLIHSFYRPDRPTWDQAATYAQFSIEYLSDMLMPYPYPHMTVVEGIIGGGMEYPMITLIGGGRSPRALFGVTFHEISHMWVPMVVGQDEKAYAWMDEGLTSFNTNDGAAAFFGDEGWEPGQQYYYSIAGSGQEVEPMRHADQYPYGTPARSIASYSKPAVAMHALRGLVGEDRFMEAYRAYVRHWAYKHPQPYDLFNTFEDVLGQDLDWFWTTLFFETWTLDHAVGRVEQNGEGVVITVEDHGLSPMPVPVRATYADGTVIDKVIPVDVWLNDQTEAQVQFEPGTVRRVEIDPDQFLPDVDRGNNVWGE